jgi:hypothetical protein
VKLKRLNLEGNPLIRPPPEIVRDGLEAIKKYMRNRATKSLLPRSLSMTKSGLFVVSETMNSDLFIIRITWLLRSLSS